MGVKALRIAALVGCVMGCQVAYEQVNASLTDPRGRFEGTYNGQPLSMEIHKGGPAWIGRGALDGKLFAFALLPTFSAAGLIALEDGILPAELHADDTGSLVFETSSLDVAVVRVGDAAKSDGGVFSGSFAAEDGGAFPNELDLAQYGQLIVGGGLIYGLPLALTGKLESSSTFRGRASFARSKRGQFFGRDGGRGGFDYDLRLRPSDDNRSEVKPCSDISSRAGLLFFSPP